MARPPHPLSTATLALDRIPADSVWHHIFLGHFPDPLGFGYSGSRFSDPRKSTPSRFGVYYVAKTFEGAFLETIVRDRRNGTPGDIFLSEDDLKNFVHVEVREQEPLGLIDLRGGKAIQLGIPTDTVRASSHTTGRRLSLALYQHASQPDGIWFPSRLHGGDNLAVFDRAVPKLTAGPRRELISCVELAPLLNTYRIGIRP